MLYKILLTLELQEINTSAKKVICQKLEQLSWFPLNDSNSIWSGEKIASDLLSAKMTIERDLNLMLRASNLDELKYAFQLSLGDISAGKLTQLQH